MSPESPSRSDLPTPVVPTNEEPVLRALFDTTSAAALNASQTGDTSQEPEAKEREPVQFYETANYKFKVGETYICNDVTNINLKAFIEYLELVGTGNAFKPRNVMCGPIKGSETYIFDHYETIGNGVVVYVKIQDRVEALPYIGSFIAEEHILNKAQLSPNDTKKKEPIPLRRVQGQ